MDYLQGIVERITYANEENGYSVIKIKSKGFSDLVSVVGNLATVNVGATLRLKGIWKLDSKYGKQFSAHEYEEIVPATLAGIEKYLGCGLIKGIGPINAKRIVNHFGLDTIQIIEENCGRLIEVTGVGPKRVSMIQKAWQEQKQIKNVMLFLQSNGVSTAYAVKIYKAYGNESIDIVKANPYRLADDIWGIGFKTADKIALQLGFEKNSYERCRSGILYVLNELSNDGHCYATRVQLSEACIKILELEEDMVHSTLDRMVDEKAVIFQEPDSIYLPPFYFSEVGVSRRINEIMSVSPRASAHNVDQILDELQKENNIVYDDIQLDAIRAAVKAKFMVLTGGPGTGKTTTTLAILKIYQKIGATCLLAAPTGRAAKRMSEATGMEAKTIHRLLEYKPPEGYRRIAENPLECDVLILDETSMVDIILMYNLLKAVPNEAIVILVGDIDQLPSVGAGNVLRDIINSGVVEVIRLTRIFRQAMGSRIITNAHRINQGLMPILKGGRESDFFFIEEETPDKIVNCIQDLCVRRLPQFYKNDSIHDIQVLCPMQRGETGAQNLNIILQEVLNPSGQAMKYRGVSYRVNDKVMQIKNNYDKNVFNGDIGTIINLNLEDKTIMIRFDSNNVEYDITELDEVILAYATTVHKSQGSEYKIVVAPIAMQHYVMLQRNLLYTCITRAKKILVLVGSKKAIGIAVSNNKIEKRNTMLGERLKEVTGTDEVR